MHRQASERRRYRAAVHGISDALHVRITENDIGRHAPFFFQSGQGLFHYGLGAFGDAGTLLEHAGDLPFKGPCAPTLAPTQLGVQVTLEGA